jgi:hypothetical protein
MTWTPARDREHAIGLARRVDNNVILRACHTGDSRPDGCVVDHHLRHVPTPSNEPVESDISGSSLLSHTDPPHRFRRLFNVLVESHNLESPGGLPEMGVYQGFCVERTTGLEPATLTLAR